MESQHKKTIRICLRRFLRASLILAAVLCVTLGMSACSKEL